MSEKADDNSKTKVKYTYEQKYIVIIVNKGSQNAWRVKQRSNRE